MTLKLKRRRFDTKFKREAVRRMQIPQTHGCWWPWLRVRSMCAPTSGGWRRGTPHASGS